MMSVGEKGLALIKSFEKCRLVAYKPTPDDVWTIGWGSTHNVAPGMQITQEDADARLTQDLSDAETCINKRIAGISITQNQYDALVSLVFNIGCRNFNDSTLLKLLLDGDDDGAANQFIRWNKQGHKILGGLTRRRLAETQLFRSTV